MPRTFSYHAVVILLLAVSARALGLPIGFGRTQGGVRYDELRSRDYTVYHDARTPHEAALTLNSLDAVTSLYERWFAVAHDGPLPVIMSARTANPSFANFVTDALELQTLGLGTRDLAWHEYAHNITYRHFDTWFGKAYSVLYLLWLPSWFLEGLAETLSVSIGSDAQAGFERYHALTGNWPSYDKLHSLYTTDWGYRGYALSGSFVSYILRTYDAKKLPLLLEDYFYKAHIWWWPYTILPFDSNLPLDDALKTLTGKNGPELYKEYQQAAQTYWRQHRKGQLYAKTAPRGSSFSALSTLQVRGDKLYKLASDHGVVTENEVVFEGQWASHVKPLYELPADSRLTRVSGQKIRAHLRNDVSNTGPAAFTLRAKLGQARKYRPILKRTARGSHLMETKRHLAWFEHRTEKTQLCYVSKRLVLEKKPIKQRQIKCPFRFKQPKILSVVGKHFRTAPGGETYVEQVWLKVKEQTLYGDRFQLIEWDPDKSRFKTIPMAAGGEPVAMTRAGQKRWLLVAGQKRRSLQQLDAQGQCQGALTLEDHAMSVHAMADGSLVMPVINRDDMPLLRLPANEITLQNCPRQIKPHTSATLYALRHDAKTTDLQTALVATSPWQKTPPSAQTAKRLAAAKPLDKEANKGKRRDKKSRSSRWRGRPIFAVPWLGADSDGTQLGLLSVPLMDEMQNETARVFVAYGPASRFPHTEVAFQSTRFWPTLQLDAFRYQQWNGRYYDAEEDDLRNAYVDERGARFTAGFAAPAIDSQFDMGMKSSYIRNYRGSLRTREGQLNEVFAGLAHRKSFGRLSWGNRLTGKLAPDEMNESFSYNQIGVGTTISRSLRLLDSIVSVGLEGSRTRGEKTRELEETYRPLKIFVPGSGGGFNNLNFPILGGGGHFSARFGSNQARSTLNWTFPLIRDVDTLVRIFYIERLDFTAFVNYGGAWTGELEAEDLIVAHAYNTDFQVDVKGFNFNFGSGLGQVLGSPLELYLTFGFDAIF